MTGNSDCFWKSAREEGRLHAMAWGGSVSCGVDILLGLSVGVYEVNFPAWRLELSSN